MIGLFDRRRWLPALGATTALLLALAACGDEASVVNTSETAVTAPTTQATPDSTIAPSPDLATALGNVGDRYAFTATVTLAGTETTRMEGTVYDGVGAYVVQTGVTSIDYVISPSGQWAREAGGEWTTLSGPAPLVDPLAPLLQPIDLTVVSTSGDVAVIEATYNGADLGFTDEGQVQVMVIITGGAITEISYEAAVGGEVATVVTTFDSTVDVAPISVPPA